MNRIMERIKEGKNYKEIIYISLLSCFLIIPGILNALINFEYKQLIIGSIVNAALFLSRELYKDNSNKNSKYNKKNIITLSLATLPSLTNILTGVLFTGFQKFTALLIPFIWLGNIILVKTNNKVFAIILKVTTIYLGFILMSNLFNYPNNVVNMLNTSMGITQIYTGISGLLISCLILKLKK